MWKEFKEFAIRGNVMDLAVAVIIGGAFGKVVTSLVNDVLMPPLSLLLGHVDFKDKFINLSLSHSTVPSPVFESVAAAKAAGAQVLAYGVFLNTIIEFTVIAFAVFLVIRPLNKLKPKPAPIADAPATKECPFCCTVIPERASRCGHCTSELVIR